MKSLYIAEKPSVAQEFMKALGENPQRRDGYSESDDAVFTWCVGHLVTMSYPAEYDASLKGGAWIPFLLYRRNGNTKLSLQLQNSLI